MTVANSLLLSSYCHTCSAFSFESAESSCQGGRRDQQPNQAPHCGQDQAVQPQCQMLPLTSSPCCSTPCCTGALEPRMRLHMSTYRAACLRCWMTLLYLRQPFPQGQLQVGCSMCHQARCQWVTTLLFQTCQRTFHPTATQSAIQQFLWGHPLWMLHPPCHSLTIP